MKLKASIFSNYEAIIIFCPGNLCIISLFYYLFKALFSGFILENIPHNKFCVMFCKISIKIVIVQYYRGKNKDDGSDNLFKYKIGLQN